ncbi:MAG: helix-turn-helix transcriptional regulator, partial [Lachnospiraceae bacterium]|nr:helix-turn-helix transcriptional regulator [Lachnospiraceae bacterium]
QEAVENVIGERYRKMARMLINFNYGFEGFSQAFTREAQKKVMDFAENIISGMVKGFFEHSCLLRRDQNGFILVLSLEGQKDFEEQIQVMSRKFRLVVKDYFEVPVSIAVSQPGAEAQDLLYQAMSAMNQTYYENSEETVFYSERCEKDDRHSSNFNINFLKRDMAAAVGQNDSRRFGEIMDQVISLFEECRPSRPQAVNACSNLYYFFVFLMEGRKDQAFPYAVDIVGHLNRMENLKSILRGLEGFRDEVMKALDLRGEVKLDRNVEMARKYVAEHYQEKISLGQVAQELNISAGHLSSVFRKQTGQKFSDYVTEVKIEKAKELIRTHKYMMYEISDMLGFDTQYYFSTVFKKITGLTPKEYETAQQTF